MGVPRICLVCTHFHLYMGSPGYSDMTPGSPASITCDMRRERGCAWPRDDDYPDVSPQSLISIAEQCEHFAAHAELKESEETSGK